MFLRTIQDNLVNVKNVDWFTILPQRKQDEKTGKEGEVFQLRAFAKEGDGTSGSLLLAEYRTKPEAMAALSRLEMSLNSAALVLDWKPVV